ncbi:Uncharacterised protein [Candidatus Venteria ishoeyi]|uniref:Uncharacterized protein n=1 Tax=Candidatus Venteria ishoeyi TaxID=1899563 RepID=A0A1H6FAF6_9GAMM|nr:Uncharacterised protein [Candidatus Venteria ishoeyi]
MTLLVVFKPQWVSSFQDKYYLQGLRFTVYGLRFTVYGLRFTVYGLRFTVYGFILIQTHDCQRITDNCQP